VLVKSELRDQAIGIFDSGIGGLTVANAINRLLPLEKIVYFGDTAHLPYGDKTPKLIKQYSKEIAKFLLSKNVKIIVIACNSATSNAFNEVVEVVKNRVPVVNVIDPVVSYLETKLNLTNIGVIGTKATIGSGIYQSKIEAISTQKRVSALATPLLAPMIEEGFFNKNLEKPIIEHYLSNKKLKGIDSLILGCTHYPLIQDEVAEILGDKISIINSAEIVSLEVQRILNQLNLLSESKVSYSEHQFYLSGLTESFQNSAKHFFQGSISFEEVLLSES
jgi:glutamate racemase